MRFPSSHRNPCVIPKSPKGWLKIFGVAFHFFIARNRRHFKFNMWVEHSKSQLTDDKTSLKWAWPRHVTHFKLLFPLRYLQNGSSPLCIFVIGQLIAKGTNLMYRLNVQVTAYGRQTVPDRGLVKRPLQNYGGSNYITGTAVPSCQILYTSRLYKFWQQDDISPTKRRGYGHMTVVMQRIARVCQRQLSYLY